MKNLKQQLIYQLFPIDCIHCSNPVLDFPKVLCTTCVDLILSSTPKESVLSISYDEHSPYCSLWSYYVRTQFEKPRKDLAAFLAIRLSYLNLDFDSISFFPKKQLGSNQILRLIAAELAAFYGTCLLEIFKWKIEDAVFDDQGELIGSLEVIERPKNKKVLVLCESVADLSPLYEEKELIFLPLF